MHLKTLIVALVILFAGCNRPTLTAPDFQDAALGAASFSSPPTAGGGEGGAAALDEGERTGCQVIRPAARRVLSVGPESATLRVLADYEGEGVPVVKVREGETLLGTFALGDFTLALSPGIHTLRVDVEVMDGGELFSCGGSVTALVPSHVDCLDSAGDFNGVVSGVETTVFAMKVEEGGTFEARVQWSLPSSGTSGGYDSYLSFVRLRVYSNGTLAGEVSGSGNKGSVTIQDIVASVGPGEIVLTAYQEATAFDADPNDGNPLPPFTVNAAVPLLVESAVIR